MVELGVIRSLIEGIPLIPFRKTKRNEEYDFNKLGFETEFRVVVLSRSSRENQARWKKRRSE